MMKVGQKRQCHAGSRISRGVAAMVLFGGLLCSSWNSDAADDAALATGLRGVLPAEAPDDLTDSISALPESWKAWGDTLISVLGDFYTKEDLNAAGQRRAIAVLRGYLHTLQISLNDSRYRQIGSQLAGLSGRLKRRVDVAEAALDTLELGPQAGRANGPAVRENLKALLAALDQYEATQGKPAAADVRRAYDALRTSAADGGQRITGVLAENYLNYNLRVDASQAFLTKVVNQHRMENGPVDDCILGAKVDGCQTTVTDVGVHLIPSSRFARMNLVVNGQVSSNTQGVTPQATVYTWGNHYFTAFKEVDFDGDRFWTGPASVSVQANNTTTGACTKLSGIPLLGRFVDNIAINSAESRRGESEAIAASRVTDRVVPQLDAEVDRDFGPQGKNTSGLQRQLATFRELGVYPETKTYKTSSNNLFMNARLMAPDELGGAAPEPIVGPGLSLQVHESLINNSTDRAGLQGQTMTQDQLSDLLEKRFTKLLGRTLQQKTVAKDPEADKGPNTMIFDAHDPIRFHAADGAINITVRAAFRQEGKEEIPAQIVTLPVKFSVRGNKIIAERGEVRVAPVVKPDNVAQQITRAGVIKAKFEHALPRREYDRVVRLNRPDKTSAAVAITRIDAVDGWVIILME